MVSLVHFKYLVALLLLMLVFHLEKKKKKKYIKDHAFRIRLVSLKVISKMELGVNFVECCQNDVVTKIMSYLDDSADLIRATAVSRSWCRFVISNCLSKKLCVRKVPSLASITACVAEENDAILKMTDDSVSINPVDWEALVREHKIYTSLLEALATPIRLPKECTALTVGVLSNTDSCDPAPTVTNVPEHIIYQLKSPTCIVKELIIVPFEDHLGPLSSLINSSSVNWPIYSGMSIRFRMGHPKSAADLVEMNGTRAGPSQQPSLDNYVWTYTSPVFLIDLVLDRIEKEEIPGLLYTCLDHFSVLGAPLEPAFKLEMFPSGELPLKYCPYVLQDVLEGVSRRTQFKMLDAISKRVLEYFLNGMK